MKSPAAHVRRSHRSVVRLSVAAAMLAAGPASATITHRPGPTSAAYRAYLDFALGEDESGLDRALAIQGETSFLVLEQALVAARRGDQARMVERAERAVALDRDNAEAHDLLARVYFRLADDGLDVVTSRTKARDHAEALVRLGRADAQVFERLAALHGQAAREAEASRDAAAARRSRDRQREILVAWGERLRQDAAWRRLAEMAREVGDVETEVQALGAATRLAPQDLLLVQELAEIHQRQGRCEEALPLLEMAAAHPALDIYGAIGVNVSLGECANAVGRHDLAQQALSRALDVDPTNLMAARELADATWDQGRHAEARAYLDGVGERVTRRVTYLEARASWDLEHGLYEDALRHAEEALQEVKATGATTVSSADLHVLVGSIAFETGEPAAAEAAARRALEVEPGNEDAAFLLAEALWEQGDRSGATDHLDAFGRRARGGVPTLLRRARWDAGHGRRAAAAQGAHAALETGLGSGRVAARGLEILSREVAAILVAVGRPEEAETVLRQALERNPGRQQLVLDLAEAILARGRPDEAAAVLDAVDAGVTDPYRIERRVRWDLEHRMADAAVVKARRALDLATAGGASAPALRRFETLLGEAYLAAAEPVAALEWLERATAGEARQPRARVASLVRALEKGRSAGAALAAASAAIELHPGDPVLELSRVRLLLATGKDAEATRSLDALVALHPRSVALRTQGAMVLEQGGAASEARRVIDSALRDFPSNVTARLMSATLHDRRGRLDEAETDLRLAIEMDPESPTPLNALGYMLAQRNVRLDEAVKVLRRAVEMAPNEQAYLDSLGWALFRQGKTAEAEKHLEAAVARDRDPVVVMHLGTLRESQGRSQEALSLYREALRFGLDEEVARVTAAVAKLAGRGSSR